MPVQSIKLIEKQFCASFKGQAIYTRANLADDCEMNIISPTPSQLCIADPDDNDVPLDYTCKNIEDLYER